jgi:hypothetical protein
MMDSFYWGTKKNGGRGTNWLRWDKIMVSKDNIWLNFWDLQGFNLAMLGKQEWNLITNSSSFLTKVLKTIYFRRSGFLEANIRHNLSYTWRSIHSTISLLSFGYRWKIDDGSNINVWTDHWIWSWTNVRPYTSPMRTMVIYMSLNYLILSLILGIVLCLTQSSTYKML